jgi:A/G-specific adenine glycosylase
MLQQTQTARIQEKLPLFLRQYPDFSALAAADNATIIRAWQGMGYNNRALRLRDCARAVTERFGGLLPDTADDLRSLPGLGPYTVSAVLSFAFHQDVVVLDVNIRRLYSRLFGQLTTTVEVMPESQLLHVASEVYPRGRSSEWHQACMDIAAQYCTARSPRCLFCPVTKACRSAFRLASPNLHTGASPTVSGVAASSSFCAAFRLIRQWGSQNYGPSCSQRKKKPMGPGWNALWPPSNAMDLSTVTKQPTASSFDPD